MAKHGLPDETCMPCRYLACLCVFCVCGRLWFGQWRVCVGAIDAVHHSACQARPARQDLHALQVLGVPVCVLCVWSFVVWAMESVCVGGWVPLTRCTTLHGQARPARRDLHALRVIGVPVCVLCVWSFVIWAMESVCVCVPLMRCTTLHAKHGLPDKNCMPYRYLACLYVCCVCVVVCDLGNGECVWVPLTRCTTLHAKHGLPDKNCMPYRYLACLCVCVVCVCGLGNGECVCVCGCH